jgi:hypothetical protein
MPDFTIDPHALWLPWAGEPMPMAVVDLDAVGDDAGSLVLPPFPVVGIGDRSHPLASQLDAVVEPPVTLATLLDNVCRQPEAAAVAVQLLRYSGGLDAGASLVAESLTYGLLQGSSGHAAWLSSRPPALSLPSGEVSVGRTEGRLDLWLVREAARNSIDRPMRDMLHEAFAIAMLDPDIERVVLRGVGKAFSTGADLSEFGTTRDPASAHAIRMRTLPAHNIWPCAHKLEVHVQGACVGAGLEMAAFARSVTAGHRAWFQLPELAMGLIPGAGGTVSVPRRIGRQRAALMILSGRRFSAQTALAWGLVDAIVDD